MDLGSRYMFIGRDRWEKCEKCVYNFRHEDAFWGADLESEYKVDTGVMILLEPVKWDCRHERDLL